MAAAGGIQSGPVGATDPWLHPQTTPQTGPNKITFLSNKAITRIKLKSHLRLPTPRKPGTVPMIGCMSFTNVGDSQKRGDFRDKVHMSA